MFATSCFSEAWPEEAIIQQVAGQLPWFHNCTLLEQDGGRSGSGTAAAIENGWSRNTLVLQIEGELYRRQGKTLTNFTRTLPSPPSDAAQQVLKDPGSAWGYERTREPVGILDVRRHVRERLAGAFDAAEVLVDPDDDIPLRRVLSKAPKPIHRV
jgi:hypothetical protein